jgi:hypothetical protein
MVMAPLQSLCTAILTINGIRVGIGLAALVAGSIAAPFLSFHRDAIRIPMLTLAVLGAAVNLLVLAWVWRLRGVLRVGLIAQDRQQKEENGTLAEANQLVKKMLFPARMRRMLSDSTAGLGAFFILACVQHIRPRCA